MNPSLRRFTVILIAVLICRAPAFGQEGANGAYTGKSAYDKILNVKSTISTLLQENRHLEIQYATIADEYQRIQQQVNMFAEEISAVTKDHIKKQDLQKEKYNSIEKLQQDLSRLNDELLIKRSRNAYLKAQSLDHEMRTKILQLKLQDLQYAQRELELAVKQKNFSLEERNRKIEEEILRMKDQLKQNIEQTQEILQQTKRLEKESLGFNKTIETFTRENRQMEDQLAGFHRKNQLNEQEVSLLKNKKLYASRKAEHLLFEKGQERDLIRKQVDALNAELNMLKRKVSASYSRQNAKRELIDTLMAMDQENQTLKDKIKEIQEKIDTLD